jgi:hypothetical protein
MHPIEGSRAIGRPRRANGTDGIPRSRSIAIIQFKFLHPIFTQAESFAKTDRLPFQFLNDRF